MLSRIVGSLEVWRLETVLGEYLRSKLVRVADNLVHYSLFRLGIAGKVTKSIEMRFSYNLLERDQILLLLRYRHF